MNIHVYDITNGYMVEKDWSDDELKAYKKELGDVDELDLWGKRHQFYCASREEAISKVAEII
jgi:hypothetical protein